MGFSYKFYTDLCMYLHKFYNFSKENVDFYVLKLRLSEAPVEKPYVCFESTVIDRYLSKTYTWYLAGKYRDENYKP